MNACPNGREEAELGAMGQGRGAREAGRVRDPGEDLQGW